jgi:O-antigen/teichoic acid export membrane protein
VLIPEWSYNGAAVATVLTEVVVLGILAAGLGSLPVRPFPWSSLGKVVLASTCMTAVSLAVWSVTWWPVAAVVSGLVYLAALHLLNVYGPGGLRALARHEEPVGPRGSD